VHELASRDSDDDHDLLNAVQFRSLSHRQLSLPAASRAGRGRQCGGSGPMGRRL